MGDTTDKIQWHSAFYAAMQLELINTKFLTFLMEYNLTKKPLEMDMLIISKNGSENIDNPIGHIFKKYNIVEYKSPGDKLNIDVFYKTIAYACLYKIKG